MSESIIIYFFIILSFKVFVHNLFRVIRESVLFEWSGGGGISSEFTLLIPFMIFNYLLVPLDAPPPDPLLREGVLAGELLLEGAE